MGNGKHLSIAETASAITYHLRAVGTEGLKRGGGLQGKFPSLCGANIAWDTGLPFASWGMNDGHSRWCSDCTILASALGLLNPSKA